MNITETGELLARIQVHDNRQIGAVTIEEWQHDLADIRYDDALEVVRAHRRGSTDYLTANHVLRGVRALRAHRTTGVDDIQPPPAEELDPDDWRAFQAWQRRTIALAATGTITPPAPSVPGPVPPEVREQLKNVGRGVPPQ